MRKFKLLTIISALVLSLGLMVAPVKAAEYPEIAEYSEIFKPTGETDAELTVTVKGTADAGGYIYLIKTLTDTTPVSVTGDNVAGELEEVANGEVTFYRVLVNTKEETEIVATFTVAGFYPTEKTDEDNGSPNYAISYTFTNQFQATIGKYAVTVYAPEGMETVKVTTPAKYASQKLNVTEDGYRTVGASGSVSPAATSGVAFTYNTPLSGTMSIVIWVLCLGIGGFVFVDRFKKAKQ